jgi:hypothetical protein
VLRLTLYRSSDMLRASNGTVKVHISNRTQPSAHTSLENEYGLFFHTCTTTHAAGTSAERFQQSLQLPLLHGVQSATVGRVSITWQRVEGRARSELCYSCRTAIDCSSW